MACRFHCNHYRLGIAHANQGLPLEVARVLAGMPEKGQGSCQCYMEGFQDAMRGAAQAAPFDEEHRRRGYCTTCDWKT